MSIDESECLTQCPALESSPSTDENDYKFCVSLVPNCTSVILVSEEVRCEECETTHYLLEDHSCNTACSSNSVKTAEGVDSSDVKTCVTLITDCDEHGIEGVCLSCDSTHFLNKAKD